MPVEFSRTTKRKRIQVGDLFVDVPVITEISFIDPVDRAQEWRYTIENSSQADRTVHVDTVVPSNFSADIELKVERIDDWSTLDGVWRGQETKMTLDNVTGGNAIPPHFETHLETHVVKYKSTDDPATWIKSELIDKFAVIDPVRRGQEVIFTLNNPQNDDDAQANPDDPEISDSDNGIDPPWRTDPFQNIVDLNGSTGTSTATPVVQWVTISSQPQGAGVDTWDLICSASGPGFLPWTPPGASVGGAPFPWAVGIPDPNPFDTHTFSHSFPDDLVHQPSVSGLSLGILWGLVEHNTENFTESTISTLNVSGWTLVPYVGSGLPTLHPVLAQVAGTGGISFASRPISWNVKFTE